METTIGSLEEQLAIANDQKQQAVLRSEDLLLEVQDLSEKLDFSNSELQRLEELVSSLVSLFKFNMFYLFYRKNDDFIIFSEGELGRGSTT